MREHEIIGGSSAVAAIPGVSPHAAPACGAGRVLWEPRHFALRPPASLREVPLSAAAGALAIISAGSVEISVTMLCVF